jgi:hypothetical protein
MSRPTELLKKAIRVTTYAELEQFVHAFARGLLNLLILIGAPGLQKSQLVRQTLGDRVFWIEGNATPFRIYCDLYSHRNQPIVLDDGDALLHDPRGVRLLKSLCQTDVVKQVSWDSDARTLKTEGIPRRFPTSSPVIIIGNEWKTPNSHVSALQDRGHLIHFVPSSLEVHWRTAEWFRDQEILDFVAERLHLVAEPSMRDYVRAGELREAGLDWQRYWLERCLSGPALLVARLKAEPSFGSEENRVREFMSRSKHSRATYFNIAKKLRRSENTRRLELKNTSPIESSEADLSSNSAAAQATERQQTSGQGNARGDGPSYPVAPRQSVPAAGLEMKKTVYNIGYGGRAPSSFVGLLKGHGIEKVVDVRSNPRRASLGSYILSSDPTKGIVKLLGDGGIGYEWLPELGNPEPKDREMTAFRELAPRFPELTRRLVEAASCEAVCVLCSEKKVASCHRELIVEYLRHQGWEVIDL